MDDLQAPADLGRPSPVLVELLYADAPRLDLPAIAARAQERVGTPARVVEDGRGAGIAFPERTVVFDDAEVPLVVWLLQPGHAERPADWIATTLRQTWDWDDAERVVRGTSHAVLVADLFAGPLHQSVRAPLYHAVLAAAVELTAPAALHWLAGERFGDPAAYLADVAGDPTALASLVNVRYVTLADHPGEQLMDTVGLAPYGLPDVQAHFVSLDPQAVAGKLFSIAAYLFEHGDVIADGHTVPGLAPDEAWTCTHEVALLGPERVVLDLDVGVHGPARGPRAS